jgi:ATP-dependent Clp protease adaptor protein ClpS
MAGKTGKWNSGAATKQAEQAAPTQAPKADAKRKPQQLPPYNVVLINDNDHTYEYVIQLLRTVFAYPEQKGYQLAKCVDENQRAIVFTTHKELAELKREQIHTFGTDHRVASCKGSMSAIIEPA